MSLTEEREFVPPAAHDLPKEILDSAVRGASALDAHASTKAGQNLLAHALVQLRRDGWLHTTKPDAIEKLRSCRDIQGLDGTWNASSYLCGMYNGLELALSILEGEREPQYRDPPAEQAQDDPPHGYPAPAAVEDEDEPGAGGAA